MPFAEGFGLAGAPRGQVITIQGVSGGTPIPTSGAGGGGTSHTDDSAFTIGTSSFTPIGGQVDDTLPDTVAEGSAGAVRMTTNRAVHVNLRDAAGAELAVGGGTQYAEDTVHVSGDTMTLAGVVRRDTASSGVDLDGDRALLSIDASGLLWARVGSALPAGTNNIGDVDILSIAAGDNNIGNVDVVTLPALPAGTNNIGDVDVLTLPALASGANTIGSIASITTSVVPGTAATNLGKAIDTAAGATDTGMAALAVRDDALTTLTPIDGDYVPLRVSSTGALHVTGGGGGTEYTVDDAAPAAPIGGTFVMERDDALSALTELEGDWTNPRANANGALWVKPDGTTIVDGSAVTQPVSGTVTANLAAGTNNIGDVDVLSVVPGTGATSLGKAVDAVPGATDTGVVSLAVRDDALATLTPVDGDYTHLRVTSTGRLWASASIDAALPAGTNNIGDVDVLSVVPGTGATALGKAEDAAHTSADTGVYALAVRDDAPAAHAGTDGDYESLHVNAEGGLWVTNTPSASGGLSIFRSLDLDETEEEVKATAGSVYGGWVTNTATATRWIKFYNATAANVTVGTTTPVLTFGIPGNSTDDIAAVLGVGGSNGLAFSTAITVAATTGVADADTGAPGANEVVVNLWFK